MVLLGPQALKEILVLLVLQVLRVTVGHRDHRVPKANRDRWELKDHLVPKAILVPLGPLVPRVCLYRALPEKPVSQGRWVRRDHLVGHRVPRVKRDQPVRWVVLRDRRGPKARKEISEQQEIRVNLALKDKLVSLGQLGQQDHWVAPRVRRVTKEQQEPLVCWDPKVKLVSLDQLALQAHWVDHRDHRVITV